METEVHSSNIGNLLQKWKERYPGSENADEESPTLRTIMNNEIHRLTTNGESVPSSSVLSHQAATPSSMQANDTSLHAPLELNRVTQPVEQTRSPSSSEDRAENAVSSERHQAQGPTVSSSSNDTTLKKPAKPSFSIDSLLGDRESSSRSTKEDTKEANPGVSIDNHTSEEQSFADMPELELMIQRTSTETVSHNPTNGTQTNNTAPTSVDPTTNESPPAVDPDYSLKVDKLIEDVVAEGRRESANDRVMKSSIAKAATRQPYSKSSLPSRGRQNSQSSTSSESTPQAPFVNNVSQPTTLTRSVSNDVSSSTLPTQPSSSSYTTPYVVQRSAPIQPSTSSVPIYQSNEASNASEPSAASYQLQQSNGTSSTAVRESNESLREMVSRRQAPKEITTFKEFLKAVNHSTSKSLQVLDNQSRVSDPPDASSQAYQTSSTNANHINGPLTGEIIASASSTTANNSRTTFSTTTTTAYTVQRTIPSSQNFSDKSSSRPQSDFGTKCVFEEALKAPLGSQVEQIRRLQTNKKSIEMKVSEILAQVPKEPVVENHIVTLTNHSRRLSSFMAGYYSGRGVTPKPSVTQQNINESLNSVAQIPSTSSTIVNHINGVQSQLPSLQTPSSACKVDNTPTQVLPNLSSSNMLHAEMRQDNVAPIARPQAAEHKSHVPQSNSVETPASSKTAPLQTDQNLPKPPRNGFKAPIPIEIQRQRDAIWEKQKREAEAKYKKCIIWSRTVTNPPIDFPPKPKIPDPPKKEIPKEEPPVVVKPPYVHPTLLDKYPVDTIYRALVEEPVRKTYHIKPLEDLVHEKQMEIDAAAAEITKEESCTENPTPSETIADKEEDVVETTSTVLSDIPSTPSVEPLMSLPAVEPSTPVSLPSTEEAKEPSSPICTVEPSVSESVPSKEEADKPSTPVCLPSIEKEEQIEAQRVKKLDDVIKKEVHKFIAPTKPVSVPKHRAQSVAPKKKGRPKGSKKSRSASDSDTETISDEEEEDEDDYQDEDFDIEKAVKAIDDAYEKAQTGKHQRSSEPSSDDGQDSGPSTSQQSRSHKRKSITLDPDAPAPKQRRSERLRNTTSKMDNFFLQAAVTAQSEHDELPESPREEKNNVEKQTVSAKRVTKGKNSKSRSSKQESRRSSSASVDSTRSDASGPIAKKTRYGVRTDYSRRVSNETITSLLGQIMTPAAPENMQILDYFESPIVRRAIVNRNTLCYAISMVQLLTRVPQLYSIIRSHAHTNVLLRQSECFICMLGRIISARPRIDDNPAFVPILRSTWPNMETEEMHCVMEAMQHFFSRLDQEYMQDHPDYVGKLTTLCSPIRKFFEIDLINDYLCKQCNLPYSMKDKSIYICVDLMRGGGTMQDMVDNLATPHDVFSMSCELCKTETLMNSVRFINLPEVLLYFIPRVRNKKREKDQTVVTVQQDLYVKDIHGVHKYLLCAFVTHCGSNGDKGHYKSYEVDRTGDAQYNQFDDAKIIMDSKLPSDINVVLALFRKEYAVAKDAPTDIIFDGRGNIAFAHEKHCKQD